MIPMRKNPLPFVSRFDECDKSREEQKKKINIHKPSIDAQVIQYMCIYIYIDNETQTMAKKRK